MARCRIDQGALDDLAGRAAESCRLEHKKATFDFLPVMPHRARGGRDVVATIRKRVAEKVAGFVAVANPGKNAEAIDAEAGRARGGFQRSRGQQRKKRVYLRLSKQYSLNAIHIE